MSEVEKMEGLKRKGFQFDEKTEYERIAQIINRHLKHYFQKECNHTFVDIMNEYFGQKSK